MDTKTGVSDVLRKALVVATKLNLADFQSWIEQELNGYRNVDVPDYRKIPCRVVTRNPYHGWIPVMFPDAPELATMLSQVPMSRAIGELEALSIPSDGRGVFTIDFPPDALDGLMKMQSDCISLGLIPTRMIGRASIHGILEAVRNVVLRWSLQLEKDGILGEGLTFSASEKKAAASATYHVQNFYGSIGNVAGGDVHNE